MIRFLSIALLVFTTSVAAQEPLPQPKTKVNLPDKMSAKVGEIILIGPFSGKHAFVWDKSVFPLGKRADLDDQKLRLVASVSGKFTVTLVSLGDGTQHEITITVADVNDVPPIEDTEVASAIKALSAAIDDLKKRVTALEGAKPPPTQILKHVTFIGPESNKTSLSVNNDPTLRAMLNKAGVVVRVLSKTDPLIASKGMSNAVELAGGAPCVILQDELGNIIGYGPMQSVSAVTDLCSKFLRR